MAASPPTVLGPSGAVVGLSSVFHSELVQLGGRAKRKAQVVRIVVFWDDLHEKLGPMGRPVRHQMSWGTRQGFASSHGFRESDPFFNGRMFAEARERIRRCQVFPLSGVKLEQSMLRARECFRNMDLWVTSCYILPTSVKLYCLKLSASHRLTFPNRTHVRSCSSSPALFQPPIPQLANGLGRK